MAFYSSEEISKPQSSLPPYPEMIFAAIEALDEADGSNKTTISKFMEVTYGKLLPENHSSILTAHLVAMRESGELIFLKNNYIKPGPETPAKRGRGRPPKPKGEDGGPLPASSKPLGLPSKPKDPLAEAIAQAAKGYPERRGRPPKAAGVALGGAKPAKASSVTGVKRGRGRPPKAKPMGFDDMGL